MKWLDISQPLMNGMAVWPGDEPFSYHVSCTKEQSGSVNVGKLTLSTHSGTHIDAPFHFDNQGQKVLDLDINIFIGPARVIDVTHYAKVGPRELADYDLKGVSRLLLKTTTTYNPRVFPDKILHLQAEVADFLREKGIRLLGVDAPSVDPIDSKELATHHALLKNEIHILENLLLTEVVPGDYQLIALPLALHQADASPVRAVLRPAIY